MSSKRDRSRETEHYHDKSKHYRDRYSSDEKHRERNDRGRRRSRDRSRSKERHKNDARSNSRERSPGRAHKKGNQSSNFRSRNRRGKSRSDSFDHANAKWGKEEQGNNSKDARSKPIVKEKPNFGLSGKLTEETNTYRGVLIKYSEPPEARKPKRRWRLYPFKGEKALQTLYIHRESAYLIGRERKVVDLPVDHPSCSKQHAALQYRLVPFTRENGTGGKRVRPYLIDLDSANGTFINNKKIDPKKYVELLEKDVIKFGFSSREYVLLHENSKDEALDDDVKQEDDIKQEVSTKNETDD